MGDRQRAASATSWDGNLGIVGAGAMGRGIAQVAAVGGVPTGLLDTRAGAAESAIAAVRARFGRLVETGRMTASDAEAAGARLKAVAKLQDLAACDTVIEAISEDLGAKQALFTELDALVGPDCILASNTSSIPIAAIASGCSRRERVGGLHFFNPVPLMRLVEVVRAADTSDNTVSKLVALGARLGRVPVVVRDSPGFLVNLGGRAFTTEALRIVHEGIASPAQVDAIMRDCWGYRMGPFELMDLTGMDVNYPVSRLIWEGYQQDPRLATSPNHKAMLDAGRLGRKTGQGWYRYAVDGRPVDVPSPDAEAMAPPPTSVALADDPGSTALRAFCAEIGLDLASDDGAGPLLCAAPAAEASTLAHDARVDHRRLVCVDLLGDTSKRVTLMTALGADPARPQSVAAAIMATGRRVSLIHDSPGFVGPRIQAMVANLGCYMAEIGLAAPEDIDTAMELGLNYPRGPLRLTEHIGANRVLTILEVLQAETGDPRYRPTSWLRRRARLGLPVHSPP